MWVCRLSVRRVIYALVRRSLRIIVSRMLEHKLCVYEFETLLNALKPHFPVVEQFQQLLDDLSPRNSPRELNSNLEPTTDKADSEQPVVASEEETFHDRTAPSVPSSHDLADTMSSEKDNHPDVVYASVPQSSMSITSVPDSLDMELVGQRGDSFLKDSIESFHKLCLTSKHDMVTFGPIENSYPTDAEIECKIVFCSCEWLHEGGCIGVIPYPWKSLNELVVRKSISEATLTSNNKERSIVFRGSELPTNVGLPQSFQLCFQLRDGRLGGTSDVFTLYRPGNEDLVELGNKSSDDDSDDGYIVIASEHALYQQRLKELTQQKGFLEFENKSLKQELEAKSKENVELAKQLTAMKAENHSLESKAHSISDANAVILKQNQETMEDLRRATDHLQKLEVEHINCLTELEKLKAQLLLESRRSSKMEEELSTLRRSEDRLRNDFSRLNGTVSQELKEKSSLRANLKAQQSNYEFLERKCVELENRNRILDQIAASRTSEAQYLAKRFECAEIEHKEKQDEREHLINVLKQTIVDLESQLDQLTKESGQSLMQRNAVETENTTLKRDIDELTEKVKQLQIICDTQADVSVDLQKKVDEMTERLQVASVEYQQIQREKFSLQKELARAKNKLEKYHNIVKPLRSERTAESCKMFKIEKGAVKPAVKVPETTTYVEAKVMDEPFGTSERNTESLEGAVGGKVDGVCDNDDIIILLCDICSEDIPCLEGNRMPLEEHMEKEHFKRGCPMCSRWFDTRTDEELFHMHIESHFPPTLLDEDKPNM